MTRQNTSYQREKIALPYRDLEKLWYGKLYATGFVDVEVYDRSNNRFLRHNHFETRRASRRGEETGRRAQLESVYQALDTEMWASRIERIRFADWATGASNMEVATRWPGAGTNDQFAARAKERCVGIALSRAQDFADREQDADDQVALEAQRILGTLQVGS